MPHLSDEVSHISDLVSAGIRTVRQVVTDLRPNLLDDVGLAAAVKDHVKRFQRDTEIECNLVLPEDVTLDEDQSVTAFRIIQEALNNVAKHAKASKVDIHFARHGDSLLLQIEDNGIGFDTARKEQSFGLLGIKERALMIGGTATIESVPGKGTLISLSIPTSPRARTGRRNK
jgi:signal transduction histidine kinase